MMGTGGRLIAAIALATVVLCVGCADVPRPDNGFRIEASHSIDDAAAQVRRCYRQPRVASIGRSIITRLRVRFAPDGTLAELPAIVAQSGITPDNQPYAEAMGEAAILSVIQCAPLHLPPELYARGWQEFFLTFSPRASV